jgi:hypothetical protein
MKRVLLIGIILAICILAMPQGVLAATAPAQEVLVTATIPNVLEFTVVGPVSWPAVAFGASNLQNPADSTNMHVKSNVDWAATIMDLNPSAHPGQMRQRATGGGAWGDHYLTNAITVATGSSGDITPGGTATSFINGLAGTDITGQDVIFKQTILATDESVAPDHYEMTVQFTCSQL